MLIDVHCILFFGSLKNNVITGPCGLVVESWTCVTVIPVRSSLPFIFFFVLVFFKSNFIFFSSVLDNKYQ